MGIKEGQKVKINIKKRILTPLEIHINNQMATIESIQGEYLTVKLKSEAVVKVEINEVEEI